MSRPLKPWKARAWHGSPSVVPPLNQAARACAPALAAGNTVVAKPAEATSRTTVELARMAAEEGLPPGVMLNVNVPQDWNGEVRITRQSSKITRSLLQPGNDPRGRQYYWLSEQQFIGEIDPDTDHAAIRDGAISITPLEVDHTHAPSLRHLAHWSKNLEESSRRGIKDSQVQIKSGE